MNWDQITGRWKQWTGHPAEGADATHEIAFTMVEK